MGDAPKAADHGQSDLARQLAENPYPVLRVMPDGTVLYANAAAQAVDGLIKGRDKSALASGLAQLCAEMSGADEVRETECTFGDRVFAFSITPVINEDYLNIYGHDMSRRQAAYRALAAKDAQLRAALDHMKGGIKLVDRDLNCVLVNPQYSEMCGYPEKLVEVGSAMLDELRFQVERGDFGAVNLAEIQEQVFAIYRSGQESRRERTFPNGKMIEHGAVKAELNPFLRAGYCRGLRRGFRRRRRRRPEGGLGRRARVHGSSGHCIIPSIGRRFSSILSRRMHKDGQIRRIRRGCRGPRHCLTC
jgi:PAS domain-containing protein